MNSSNKIVALLSLLTVIIIFTWSCQQEDEFVPLKIDLVSPAEVLIGDTIILEGAGFSPDFATNEVYFSGKGLRVAPVKGTTSNRLVVPVPDSATTGSIRVNILDEEIFDSPQLRIRTPVFESITPNTGYVGDTIVIKGENFRSDRNNNHVMFAKVEGRGDGVLAEVTHSTNTELHVIVPEGSKAGNVSVLGFQGPKFNFKVGKITSISPTKGRAGDTLTINGVGFILGESSIYFNQGVSAVELEEGTNTSREWRAIVPPEALNGKIRMDVRIGPKIYSLLSDSIFHILPSIESLSSPSGPPGYPLTIRGSGFAPKNTNVVSATINNVPATIKNFDTQSIVITVPADASSGQVKVTVNGNEATGPEFQVTAAGTPVLERLSKDEGFVGDEITIYGLYFSPEVTGNEVKFGSVKAEIKEASSTALKVTVPDGAVTGNVSVSSLDIPAPSGLPFTVNVAVPKLFTISEITPTSVRQGRVLTIKGTNFSNANGDIAVYITQTFGGRNSYELLVYNTTIKSSTEITAAVVPIPQNGSSIVFAPGIYNVSIRKASDGRSAEDLSNKMEITIEWPAPVIKSITPPEAHVGDIVTITGENFDETDGNNTVEFSGTVADINPDGGLANTIKIKVPDVPDGVVYDVTVTTGTNISEKVAFEVLKKVATTVQPKPVYYLGADGSTITLNKITKVNDSQSSTLIFSTSGTDGITSMLVDLNFADMAKSRIYMSQFSFDYADQDGIFSMPLNGKSRKRIVLTTPPDPDAGAPGDGQFISDLGLNAEDNSLYWSTTDNFELLTAKTNDNPINKPRFLTQIPVGNISPIVYGVTYSNGKVYYTGTSDDPNDNYKPQSEIFSVDITSKAVTKIFDRDDKLGIVYDLKIDEENNKMYMLSVDGWDESPPKVYKANLAGGNLQPLLEFEEGEIVLGMSLDLEAGHIYWLQDKGGNHTIQMARMDGENIGPGKTQFAYNVNLNLLGSRTGSIAVEAPRGGAAGRVGSMSLQLKYRLKKPK